MCPAVVVGDQFIMRSLFDLTEYVPIYVFAGIFDGEKKISKNKKK